MSARSLGIGLVLIGAVGAVVGLALWLTGALSGAVAPDTQSYLSVPGSADLWGNLRHPLYGWIVGALGGAGAAGSVVRLQAALHLFAALALFVGAAIGGIGFGGAFSLGLAALLSQAGLFHLRLLLPQSPAISLLILTFAGVLAASRSRSAYWVLLAPVGLCAGAAYLLAPAFLPSVIVVPLLWLMLVRRHGQSRCIARMAALACALALPFAAQSAFRWRAAGDFNIVSFGGVQMSAMAGLMLSPDVIERLPSTVRPTAEAVLAAREKAEEAGRVARTPLNSAGSRSFVSAALGYFDIYARTYDDFLWGEIAGLRGPQESWVAFNRRLANFSLAVVAAAPLRWAAWIAGATSRLVGRMIITNATDLIALLVLLGAATVAFMRKAPAGPAASDILAVSLIALAWIAATSLLAVTITFPASRYIDTAAVLLPALPLLIAGALFQGLLHLRARADGRLSQVRREATPEPVSASDGDGR